MGRERERTGQHLQLGEWGRECIWEEAAGITTNYLGQSTEHPAWGKILGRAVCLM